MDGERSASANLAKLKKKMIRQNPASPKPRLTKYSTVETFYTRHERYR